jgi:hypothetical protein
MTWKAFHLDNFLVSLEIVLLDLKLSQKAVTLYVILLATTWLKLAINLVIPHKNSSASIAYYTMNEKKHDW